MPSQQKQNDMEETVRLMRALVKKPPKTHEDLKDKKKKATKTGRRRGKHE